MTAAIARLDLTLDTADKDIVARGAALMGTTMAAFVRAAAKEKAQQLIDREMRIEMSAHDFDAFAAALNQPWQPNAALQRALQGCRRRRLLLEEHRLDPARHRRDAFRSGEPALDEYLRRYAAQQSSKGADRGARAGGTAAHRRMCWATTPWARRNCTWVACAAGCESPAALPGAVFSHGAAGGGGGSAGPRAGPHPAGSGRQPLPAGAPVGGGVRIDRRCQARAGEGVLEAPWVQRLRDEPLRCTAAGAVMASTRAALVDAGRSDGRASRLVRLRAKSPTPWRQARKPNSACQARRRARRRCVHTPARIAYLLASRQWRPWRRRRVVGGA